MRKAIFTGVLLGFCFVVNAQLSSSASPKILLQANVQSNKALWYEAGLLYLGGNHLDFQFKVSHRSSYTYKEDEIYISSVYQMPGFGYDLGKVSFNSSFSYIKPGYIFFRLNQKVSTVLLGINGVFGLSKNQLEVQFNDPLLGSSTEVFRQDVFHKGLELEFKLFLDLGPHVALSFGSTTGSSIKPQVLFPDVWNGVFSKHPTYAPGMGYENGGYFFISTGIIFKPN